MFLVGKLPVYLRFKKYGYDLIRKPQPFQLEMKIAYGT